MLFVLLMRGVYVAQLLCLSPLALASGSEAASSRALAEPVAKHTTFRFPARFGVPNSPEQASPSEQTVEPSDELDNYLLNSPNSSEEEQLADDLIYASHHEDGLTETLQRCAHHDEPLADKNDKGKKAETLNDPQSSRWPDLVFSMTQRIKIVQRLARIFQLSEKYIPNILRARYEHEDGVKILSDDMHVVVEAAQVLKLRGFRPRTSKKKQKAAEQEPSGIMSAPIETAEQPEETPELSKEEIKQIFRIVGDYWHSQMSPHTKRDARRRILAAIREPGIARKLLEDQDQYFTEAFARRVGPARYKQYQWQLQLPMTQVEDIYGIVLNRMADNGINGQTRAMASRRLGMYLNHARAQQVLQGDKEFITRLIRDITTPVSIRRNPREQSVAQLDS